MKPYSLTHLADQTLLREFKELVAQDRVTTAALLAHLAEVDERKLYLPASYPSMYMYCVRELRMSEETAFRRIRVARTARQFPAILPALADGRLNITAVLLLTPHLTQETADGLLAVAMNKSKAEIELLLAVRFPQPDVPTVVLAIGPAVAEAELATRPADQLATQLAPEPVAQSIGPGGSTRLEMPASRAMIRPLSARSVALQLTIDQETHKQLLYAQALLGHALPSGDVAGVLKRALDALVQQLEQKKFAKCTRSRSRQSHADGRYVPAEIRRSVWHRDGGQCTFVGASGKRCEERTRLEFDHVEPIARGGLTTAGALQLKCRPHNQYAAECAFGTEFMRRKRSQAHRGAAPTKVHVNGQAQQHDVIPWLRQLGFSAEEARRGAAQCAHLPDSPLEQRVRVALRSLAPGCARRAVQVHKQHCMTGRSAGPAEQHEQRFVRRLMYA